MFGSEILEIIIGLVFLYWLLSVICSSLNELIAWAFSLRAKDLEKGIRNLLNDPEGTGLTKRFYDHVLISVFKKKKRNPSYIPARTFALTLIDINREFAKMTSHPANIEEMKAVVNKIQNDKLRETLLLLISEAGSKLDKFLENIEKWFNDAMDRVSGWYKRRAQAILGIMAILVSVAFNADTFSITKSLMRDDSVRATVVLAAQKAVGQPSPAGKTELGEVEKTEETSLTPEAYIAKVKEVQKELQKLPLPLGWYEKPEGWDGWIIKLFGLLFTAIAVSLGAPFWYDFLDKLLKMRQALTGKRPESNVQKSETVK